MFEQMTMLMLATARSLAVSTLKTKRFYSSNLLSKRLPLMQMTHVHETTGTQLVIYGLPGTMSFDAKNRSVSKSSDD